MDNTGGVGVSGGGEELSGSVTGGVVSGSVEGGVSCGVSLLSSFSSFSSLELSELLPDCVLSYAEGGMDGVSESVC